MMEAHTQRGTVDNDYQEEPRKQSQSAMGSYDTKITKVGGFAVPNSNKYYGTPQKMHAVGELFQRTSVSHMS